MERMIDKLKSTPRAPGVGAIRYPGEIETFSDLRLRERGIELSADTAAELWVRAARFGIEAPFRRKACALRQIVAARRAGLHRWRALD